MVVAIVTSLFVAIQDPVIQKFAVRFVSGYLSEKTGADIKVGRIIVTPDLKVFVRDVSVKDLNDNNLAKIGVLRAKFHLVDLLEGEIHLSDVALQDADVNLIQYEGTNNLNFQFLVDFFSTDKEKDPNKTPMSIFVDRISLKNVDFQLWDQNKSDSLKTAQHLMDYAHLDLDDINLQARHFALVGDSIYTVVEMLRANEHSGLQLKHFQSDVVVCQKGIFLNDMQMETNNSLFHLDLNMKYNSFKAFKQFVDSVEFDANIYPTDVLLSDIGYFTAIMFQMPDRVHFEGKFSGPIEHFSVKDMNVNIGKKTTIKGDLSMHPLDFENGYHSLNIKNMHFTYDDLANFYIPGKTGTIPLPEALNTLESGDIKLNFRGSYNNFNSNIDLSSNIANMKASVARNKKGIHTNVFSGAIDAQRIDVGMFANTNLIGQLDMNADFSILFPEKGNPELELNGKLYHAELIGNQIDEVVLNGEMRENRFKGKVNIDDDDLYLTFNGLIDFSDAKKPKSDFEAVIRDADLHALKLMKEESVSKVSTKIYANMTGFDIDELEGSLHLDSTLYVDSRGEYFMSSFDARIVNDNLMQRRINLKNDFFDFEMGGKMNFAHLMMALNEYGDSFVHFPIFERKLEEFQDTKLKHDVEQDFFLQLTLKDTKTLSRLFMPSLQIDNNTTVTGTFTSRNKQLNMTVRSQGVQIGKLMINNVELRNFNAMNSAFGTLSVGGIAWTNITETDTVSYGIDNISCFAKMGNDTISTRFIWDDESLDDHNKALIRMKFTPHEKGGLFFIPTADLLINDTLWTIDPNNYVDLSPDRVEISNINFSHSGQSIQINGYVPNEEQDTLSLVMNRFDVSMLDVFFAAQNFDLDGNITGNALVSNLRNNPMVLADLVVKDLGINGDNIGDASIVSGWDNEGKLINVDMGILTSNKQTLNVLGSYYTQREDENLDFRVEMDSLKLAIINPFVSNFISRVQGFGHGQMTVKGSLKAPRLDGKIIVKDGGCKVGYLNTFYTFSPTILLNSKEIELQNMEFVDTLGNKALVEGKIYHNYLKDFRFDLKVHPRDFLVMATTVKDNDTFYGSVIANGLATVEGPLNNILLDVKAMTRKGTKLTLPLNRVSTVSENDFIVFINNPEEEENGELELQELVKQKNNFALKLDVNVTDDAGVKIFLPGDIGTIDATGHGNLKIGTSSTESFSLIGNYAINNGRFLLNFKDFLTRTFNLQQGGTISWTGSPTEGQINATGVYSLKAPLSSLGIQVDSTSSIDNVNVECMIHLKDALLNPTITFGMRLPNATEDVNQTVFAMIDTTNQAVMSSQVLSLLVFGSFANTGNYDYGTGTSLGNLINNFLPNLTLDVGSGLDVGFKYYNNSMYYDEMQIALRTELFENRLIVETNVGVISNNTTLASNASNVVGEFDIKYKLTPDGRFVSYLYNHSNYGSNFSSFSFDKIAPYTQGLGISYGRTFDRFRDLFKPKKTTVPGSPMMNRGIKEVPKP